MRQPIHMHVCPKTVIAMALILLVCTSATATEITHDWTVGGWVNNGIGFTGFKQGDGSADTEFRYGRGHSDYLTFPFHIYWIPVIAFAPIAGFGAYLYARSRRKQAV